MFLGHPDPDPDPDQEPSINKQKKQKKLNCKAFLASPCYLYINVNLPTVSTKQKNLEKKLSVFSDPRIFALFFGICVSKDAKFHADFSTVLKSYQQKTFVMEVDKSSLFRTLLLCNFYIWNFFIFSPQIMHCFDSHIQMLRRNYFKSYQHIFYDKFA